MDNKIININNTFYKNKYNTLLKEFQELLRDFNDLNEAYEQVLLENEYLHRTMNVNLNNLSNIKHIK